MPGFLPDTACIVAALSEWHEHHEPAATEIERRRARGEAMLLAAPSLIETYSVLTRLPRPRRLVPADALALIEDEFLRRATVVTLDEVAYMELLRRAVREGVAGGRIYDAVIAACARVAAADVLLTFNDRDFTPLVGRDMMIVVPRVDET
jgi:predicted nucleic acid-binding protein